jgi:DNA polymerase (family X)
MPIHNADIAAIFETIADLLEIQDANPFRVRAYRNAARIVGDSARDFKASVEKGEDLKGLPGIGADLAAKIHEIIETGTCALVERLRSELPPAITELLKMPGLGPKKVKALHQRLNVHTVEELRQAACEGRIRDLPGFGARTEERILQGIEARAGEARRFRLAMAAQYADALLAYLKRVPGVEQVAPAGSFRRMKETVGDLDVLVTTRSTGPVMERFTHYDEVRELLSSGPTRASAMLRCGLQVDLRAVARESFGAALCYFTGSKAHNIVLRRLAQERSLKLNEYGVFRGDERIAGDTEESVYRCVDLPYIPPELREDRGEIEAARAGTLPHLIELSDIKGDLHSHTTATDGRNTLQEMAAAAKAAGLQYLAITEHSRHLSVARGLDARRLAKHVEEIDRVNAQLPGVTLLKGIEVDILEDGALDLPDAALQHLDLVVGAVHSRFDLSPARQTDRIVRAMDHPYFTILAHPNCRLIGERPAIEVDMPMIIAKAKSRGCFLELNAQPERLDLFDVQCQMARDAGVLVSINSDAHSSEGLSNLRFGIGQGRRGWLEKKNLLNARSLAQLRPLLRRTMGRHDA